VRTSLGEIAPHPPKRHGAHGNESLAAPFPNAHHIAGREVDVLDPERKALAGPHSGGVEELKECPVSEPSGTNHRGGFKERRHFRGGEGAGEPS
jgi:hypothetical protein